MIPHVQKTLLRIVSICLKRIIMVHLLLEVVHDHVVLIVTGIKFKMITHVLKHWFGYLELISISASGAKLWCIYFMKQSMNSSYLFLMVSSFI